MSQLGSREFLRDQKFARFARSVELALADFPPEEGGSRRLLSALLSEYGGSFEARRQMCILFALAEPEQQPVEPLRDLLRRVENSSVASVSVAEPGEFVARADLTPEAWANDTQLKPPPWLNISAPQVVLSLAKPVGTGGRPAKIVCTLAPIEGNLTRWAVQSANVKDPGCGYASDMNLEPRIDPRVGLRIAALPRLEVKLARPGRISSDQRKALPKTLQRKLTGLLPPSLLPTYSERLKRMVPDQSVPLTPDPDGVEESRRLDEVFGPGRRLDRFRADFVFGAFDSTYGPVGLSPLERERRLMPAEYWRLAISGGLAALLKEFVFLPAKNVKFRLQTDPALGGEGMLGAFLQLSRREPLANFYRGADVACVVALLFGLVSFGTTEYLKRELVISIPDLNEVVALVIASALSVVLALLLVTPLEIVMARVMSAKADDGNGPGAGKQEAAPFWGIQELQRIFTRSGWRAIPELYEEYWLLLSKELAFVVTKFVVFDSLREAILFVVPAFAEERSVLVACGCGAVAGAVAAVTSHPIDTIFALRATGDEEGSDGLPSLSVLFRGVGARVLLFSPGIALLFLIYDFVKTALGVGSAAFLQTLDLLGTARS